MNSNATEKPCHRCKTKYALCVGRDTCPTWQRWLDHLRERGEALVEKARREKAAMPL